MSFIFRDIFDFLHEELQKKFATKKTLTSRSKIGFSSSPMFRKIYHLFLDSPPMNSLNMTKEIVCLFLPGFYHEFFLFLEFMLELNFSRFLTSQDPKSKQKMQKIRARRARRTYTQAEHREQAEKHKLMMWWRRPGVVVCSACLF